MSAILCLLGRKLTDQNEARRPVDVRWRPPLDIILATGSFVVSAATLLFASPLLADYWFPPHVTAKIVVDLTRSTDFDITNTGWKSATNVDVEFDAFATIGDITLRPDAGASIVKKADGGFRIVYPSIAAGEVFKVFVEFTDPSDMAKEFGAVGISNLRSDAGPGEIIYK